MGEGQLCRVSRLIYTYIKTEKSNPLIQNIFQEEQVPKESRTDEFNWQNLRDKLRYASYESER